MIWIILMVMNIGAANHYANWSKNRYARWDFADSLIVFALLVFGFVAVLGKLYVKVTRALR